MAKALHLYSRHTGHQFIWGLREEFGGPGGYEDQSCLGCLDAPTCIAGGAVQVDEYSTLRFASERGVMREGTL